MPREQVPRLLPQFLIGLALLTAGVAFAWHIVVPEAYVDFRVLSNTGRATGILIQSDEVEREDEAGSVRSLGLGVYRFNVAGKGYLSASTKPGEPPRTTTVEYAAGAPTVNRPEGTGAQTMREWMWRKLGLGLVVFGFCLAPGVGAMIDVAEKRRRVGSGVGA